MSVQTEEEIELEELCSELSAYKEQGNAQKNNSIRLSKN